MLLTEVFDKPMEWEHIDTSRSQYIARFKNDYDRYTFAANLRTDDDENKHWEVVFTLQTLTGSQARKVGITGTGNAMQIFATIVEIMRAFISAKNPQVIKFTADEPSRIKLYDRMVTLLKRNGFSVSRESDSIGQEYTAIKK